MANVELTPASLVVSAGNIPMPFVALNAAAIGLAGGAILTGPELTSGLSKAFLRLDRLTRGQPITEGNTVNIYYQGLWQKNCEAVERAFTELGNQVDGIEAVLSALQQTQEAAAAATAAAQQAQAELSIAISYLVPLDVLTADSSGIITIAAHERDYSGVRVNVNGSSISGLTPGLFYRVYYNDAGREGGAVAYVATQDVVTQSGAVHVVGGVKIPVAGEPPVTGNPINPPGYVSDKLEADAFL